MKKLLFAVIGALALASSAFAAEEVSPVALSITNYIPAASTYTNTANDVVDLQGWRSVSLQVTGSGLSGSTSNVTVTLARSLSTARSSTAGFLTSAAVLETIRPITFVFALSGTNSRVAITNFPATAIDGVSGIKVYSVATGSDAVTNLAVRFLRKRTD